MVQYVAAAAVVVVVVVVVQSLSRARLFATPWTAAHRLPCPPLSPGVQYKKIN